MTTLPLLNAFDDLPADFPSRTCLMRALRCLSGVEQRGIIDSSVDTVLVLYEDIQAKS